MESSIVLVFLLFKIVFCFTSFKCPSSCICDAIVNKTTCVGKNIINTNIGLSHFTQILDLSHNDISILRGNEFQDSELRQLKQLHLEYNLIDGVERLTFNNLIHLEYVDLSNNHIRYLIHDTFKYNPNLKVLNVSHNDLTVTSDQAILSHVPALEVLNIARCGLKQISKSFFSSLDNLKVLNVSGNAIFRIRLEMFESLINLTELDLSRNGVVCNEETAKVKDWLDKWKIFYPPFCEVKDSNKAANLTMVVASAKMQLSEKYTTAIPAANRTDFVSTKLKEDENESKKFNLLFLLYVGISAFQVGILVGFSAACCCFLRMSGKHNLPSPPMRTCSLSGNRFIERTEEELPTPPGTPPSPYRSHNEYSYLS